MKTSLLLIDCLPTPELLARYKVTLAGMGVVEQSELLEVIVDVDLASVEGQARLMDWLRQN